MIFLLPAKLVTLYLLISAVLSFYAGETTDGMIRIAILIGIGLLVKYGHADDEHEGLIFMFSIVIVIVIAVGLLYMGGQQLLS